MIQAVTPTFPVANGLIGGEFKAYFNYNTPLQRLIGATRDGCKIDLERAVKPIAHDGAFGNTLDSDGVPMVRYEGFNIKLTLNSLYLKYFNNKNISNMESDGTWESGNWAETGGTYAAETSIVNTGLQSAKCSIASGQTGHGIKEVFSSSKDLTVFDNAEASTTSDYIGFAIYITSAMLTILGTDVIRLIFHNDADLTETNYQYYDIDPSTLTADQWNNIKVLKSAFTAEGTGAWTGVTGVSIEVPTETDDALEFYIDSLSLIQNQSDSAIVSVNGNPFGYTVVAGSPSYKKYVSSLDISDNDYLDNITVVGQKLDGKMIKWILKDCLNDGGINLAMETMDEVVNETVFTAHYNPNSGLEVPLKIREYLT